MVLLQKNSSIEKSRRTQPFYAKKQSYNLGDQVQIEVDLQREYIDFENSRLVFQAVFGISTDARTNAWFASQIVKNLRVKTLAGQMIGHEIREYRAWAQMYMNLTSNNEFNKSFNAVLEGAPNTAKFGGNELVDAGSTIQYAHKFLTHIFSIKQYYPAHFHQGIMIEFDLPSNIYELAFTEEASADALPNSIKIQDIKYIADLVQLKPQIENKLQSIMEQQRLFVDYEEVLTQENALPTTNTSVNYDVIGIDGRVKNIFSYLVQDADKSNGVDRPEKQYFGIYSGANVNSYRYKLGANYLNYENINTTGNNQAQQIYELLKALDIHDCESAKTKCGDSFNLTRTRLLANRFVLAKKVDKSQKRTNQTISSMVDKDRNNVRVELSLTGGQTEGTIYTHIHLDKRIQLLSGSMIRNVRS